MKKIKKKKEEMGFFCGDEYCFYKDVLNGMKIGSLYGILLGTIWPCWLAGMGAFASLFLFFCGIPIEGPKSSLAIILYIVASILFIGVPVWFLYLPLLPLGIIIAVFIGCIIGAVKCQEESVRETLHRIKKDEWENRIRDIKRMFNME